MNNKTKRNIIILSGFILFLDCFCILNFKMNLNQNEADFTDYVPKNSIFLISPIVIDGNDNWVSLASSEIWCYGNGTINNPYIIENVSIDGQRFGNCLYINHSDVYFEIRNSIFHNSGTEGSWRGDAGIKLQNVLNGKLINNTCSNNLNGIVMEDSNATLISGNLLEFNFIHGSYIASGYNNTLYENLISNNLQHGVILAEEKFNNITGNNINVNGQDGICLIGCNNFTISNNSLFNNSLFGIRLYHSYFNDFMENSMNYCGFYTDSHNNYIDTSNLINGKPLYYYENEVGLSSNNFSNAGQIILVYCRDSMISNLDFSNGSTGISLILSTNCTIRNVTSTYNKMYGFNIEFGSYNKIFECKTNFNRDYGILISNCDNSVIFGNTMNNNSEGGLFLWASENNSIFLNNFLKNNVNALDDHGNDNRWDNRTIGNYWDDYNGNDNNDDGIGDIPYNISGSAGGVDRYPIWNDGEDKPPIIIINYPTNGSIFGYNPPNFNIRIIEDNLDLVWYTINNEPKKFIITENDTIDTQAWSALSYDLITIRFHANDTKGYYNSSELIINKTSEANPYPSLLLTDAGDPDLDGCFNLTWSKSIGADNYSLFISNRFITEIDENLTILLDKSTLLNYQMYIHNNDDYYFIVAAYNESGYTYSNCIKVVTELPIYFLGFEVGAEIIWKITNITDLATKFNINPFNIPKSTSYLDARMKFTIKNITSVTYKMEHEPYGKGYWNITLDIWNWTLGSFSPEPDLENSSGLVPKHAFGLNLLSYFCPTPPFEYFSQFEIPPSSYVNVTGTSVISISMANGEIITLFYSFDNETGVQSILQFKYANGTIIYEHILVSVSKPIINPPISIPFGGFFIIVLILSSFGIILIHRKFDSVESILVD